MKKTNIIIFIFIFLILPQIVKAQTVTENIIFAINQDYAQQNSDWQSKAQEIIDYVNEIFAKTTDIKYQIAAFKTYQPDQFLAVKNNDSYYYYLEEAGYVYAATLFFWQPTNTADEALVDTLVQERGFRFYYDFNYELENTKYDKPVISYKLEYLSSFKPELEALNLLAGRDYLNNKYGPNEFEKYAANIVHEFGHTFGLGMPDIYLYNESQDKSGAVPVLSDFDAVSNYGHDPMIFFNSDFLDFKFNQLNSLIINQNSRHQKTAINPYYYRDIFADKVKIIVSDNYGNPIDKALIKVYGSRNACLDCAKDNISPLLENKQTNDFGEVFINPTTVNTYYRDELVGNHEWLSKIIKVYVNGQSQAQYLTTYDLQQAKILNNDSIYEIEFIFQVPDATDLLSRLAGYILLQVEQNGEAWYVNPVNHQRYYLGRPQDAFNIMRDLGLGIKHQELVNYLNTQFPQRLAGRILIDVEANGEAYYIYPKDLQGYYLGRPQDAFAIMRNLGLGITDNDLGKIQIAQ